MPLLPLLLLTGGVSFGAGFFTGSKTTQLIKVAALGGGCYMAYQVWGAKS